MSDLLVPIETVDVVSSSCGAAKSGRGGNIIEIGDIELAFCSACRHQIRVLGIKLESFDGAAVLFGARDEA